MRQFPFRRTVVALATTCALTMPVQAADSSSARNLVLQASNSPVRQSQRLALVIGNSAYKEAPLVNPANDARAMARALQDSGFTVMLHTDVNHRGLLGAVRDFGSRLRQGGVGLFYFAGHGMQIKGRNYLIPVGADIQREDEIAYSALDAQAVLDKMEAAGNGANLILLDACRNNPFARSFRSSNQGLAQMEAPVGTLVAFSTAPGSVASDGQGQNGLYTQHLLAAMRKPGAKVEDVFKQVRAAVRRESQGKQIPWETTSLEGDLYFLEPPAGPTAAVAASTPAVPASAVADAADLDDALWHALRGSSDAAVIRAYLERFPMGRHAAHAQQTLLGLQASTPSSAAALPIQIEAAGRPSAGSSVAASAANAVVPAAAFAEPPGKLNVSHWDVAAVMDARQRVLQSESAAPVPTSPASGTGSGPQSEADRLTALLQAAAAQQPPRVSWQQAPQQAEDQRLTALLQAEVARLQANVSAEVHANQAAVAGVAAVPPNKQDRTDRPTSPARPTLTTPNTMLAGDLWVFKVIHWGKTSEMMKLQVKQIDDAGLPMFVDDEHVQPPITRFVRQLLSPQAHGVAASTQHAVWWGAMQPGDSRSVTFRGERRRSDGSVVPADSTVKLHRRGTERVKVAAGEFDAIRLDADGVDEFVSLNGAAVQQRWNVTVWYVPELRGFAATEAEVRQVGGVKLEVKRRNELQYFDPGADLLAAR